MHLHLARSLQVVSAVALAVALVACGGGSDAPKATQVAAKVGKEEITIHQVNQLLQGMSAMEGQDPKALSRAMLDKLIDQQLAVTEATEAKLHRSPEVVAQIEGARRDILARAYLQQISATVARPSADEVEAYYRNNPALFAERRVFNVQELVVPLNAALQAAPGAVAELRRLAQAPGGLQQAAQWLQAQNIAFASGTATRAAEQLPLDALPQVHALADGQTTVLQAPNNLTVVQVVSSQRLPMAKAEALPRIEAFLFNQRVNEQVSAKLKDLRAATTIAYLGEFANAPVAAPAATPATTPAAGQDPALDKGVAGIQR